MKWTSLEVCAAFLFACIKTIYTHRRSTTIVWVWCMHYLATTFLWAVVTIKRSRVLPNSCGLCCSTPGQVVVYPASEPLLYQLSSEISPSRASTMSAAMPTLPNKSGKRYNPQKTHHSNHPTDTLIGTHRCHRLFLSAVETRSHTHHLGVVRINLVNACEAPALTVEIRQRSCMVSSEAS